ncbi:hypothetical protein FKM82_008908 [Ascaphus truei]
MCFYHFYQALTDRLDSVLLEKAESQQQLVSLKKDHVKIKHEAEVAAMKVSELQQQWEQSSNSFSKEIEAMKDASMQARSKHKEEVESLRGELQDALKKQHSLADELNLQQNLELEIKKLEAEIQHIRPTYEDQISGLHKALEAVAEEKNQEITNLKDAQTAYSEQYHSEIQNLHAQLLRLTSVHQDEVSDLMHQLETAAGECERERDTMQDLDNQYVEKEKLLIEELGENNEKHKNEIRLLREKLEESSNIFDVQNKTPLDSEGKIEHLESLLTEFESQQSILKDELTYTNNVKIKLEMEVQHLKSEYFHEREELEFKINELQLAIEDYNGLIEKLKSQLQGTKEDSDRLVKQHSEGIQAMREQHKKEISEIKEAISSHFENERLSFVCEIRLLKEQCGTLQQEKEEAVNSYENLRETLVNLQAELGESAGKISQEFATMKQQQATDVHELQQKLRTAYKDKNELLETVNRLQAEVEVLSCKQTECEELQLQINNLRQKNEAVMASVHQKDDMLKDLEVKLGQFSMQNADTCTNIKSSSEEIHNLQEICMSEQARVLTLQQEAKDHAKLNAELKQKLEELTEQLQQAVDSRDQSHKKIESLQQQLETFVLDKQKLEIESKNCHDEVLRLNEENDFMRRDLDSFVSEHSDCLTLRDELKELKIKLQLVAEDKEQVTKLFESEQQQMKSAKCQVVVLIETLSIDHEEQDINDMLQAISEAVSQINEEKQHMVLQRDERSVQFKRLQEEMESQCAELGALLSDYSREKVLLKEELEATLADKEALQGDLLEMKNSLEKAKLENQELLSHVERVTSDLDALEKQELLRSKQEDLQCLPENKESDINTLTLEIASVKDSLSKSTALELEQKTYIAELQTKIENLVKESKEREEKCNKIKAVAIKAKRELDSSKKEVQSTREALDLIRTEKDNLASSMKDLVHGAEEYQNLSREYDRQAERLDMEKERADNNERHVEELSKRLQAATLEEEKLYYANEDFVARIETLQSNNKLLEAQIIEMQRAKTATDKELEAERLLKEQKMKDHSCAQKQLEDLQTQLQKEKKQLQKTMHELELVRKDAQQSTLMDMEIADYDRLVKELNQKISSKSSQLEDLEQEVRIQKQKQEMLREEISSLQSTVEQHEEQSTKMKQLLVKTKKELADSKQSESDHSILQASLKGELEASQQQVEAYKIHVADLTSDQHKLQEQLRALTEQQQRTTNAYQQKLAALQEENAVSKAEQATVIAEFESYKVRVHNVLKQQKNRSASQAEQEVFKQEREHMQAMLDQVKAKLQETQHNLQINATELQALQSEHDPLLERHNKMVQETVAKEAELREKLCTVQSENLGLKTEHEQTVSQLSAQNETLRNNFKDQVRHLQEDHRKTVETLQHQLSKVEAQLFQLKSEVTVTSSQQPLKGFRERRPADLPLLDLYSVAREEGEGMETTDTESVSSASTYVASLEQLLHSSEARAIAEPPQWQPELSKEELIQKLNTTAKRVDHLSGLLHETEATNAILMEQIKLLKNEIRRLERNQEREKSVANLEYLKNVLLQFIFLKAGSERQRLLPVIDTMLQLSPEEKGKLFAIAQGEEESASRPAGWSSYLHSWSGLR